MSTHTDWWRCDRCEIKQPIITTDYDYKEPCPLCGKPMKLIVRMEDEE